MNESVVSLWCSLSQSQSCSVHGSANCAEDRGYVFRPNESTSWSTSGLDTTSGHGAVYDLAVVEEKNLDSAFAAAGSYGYDTVTLGLPGSGLPTLPRQLIAGIATKEFYLGTIGLSPYVFNFTMYNEPVVRLQPHDTGRLIH